MRCDVEKTLGSTQKHANTQQRSSEDELFYHSKEKHATVWCEFAVKLNLPISNLPGFIPEAQISQCSSQNQVM